MKLVKQIHFSNIFFDESKKMLLSEWKEGNEDIGEDILKESITEMAAIIRSYSPLYVVADDSKRKRVYEVELQNWIATTLAEASISVGVKVYAIVMPGELIAHLSTEQTAEEIGELPLSIKYFGDKDDAVRWIANLDKDKS